MIRIVIGKPGSGKSYHIVRYLVDYLTTMANKENFERHIYTNLSLNIEACQKYFDREKIKINVSSCVTVLSDHDLHFDESLLAEGDLSEERRGSRSRTTIKPSSRAFFWNRFPDNSLIIIDEIQKYLSSVKEIADCEEQSLIEYFSLHRHRRHDWIFLTQNLMSLSVDVRRVSESVTETLNTKQLTLPFPLSIPLRDIQTLLLGFGINNQLYRVREGRLENSYRVSWEGGSEAVLMKKEIFLLYSTHTLTSEDEKGKIVTDAEVPFDLGPGAWRRALWWFTKKHFLHLFIKALIAWFLGHIFFSTLRTLADPIAMKEMLLPDHIKELDSEIPYNGSSSISVQSVPVVSVDREFLGTENTENFQEVFMNESIICVDNKAFRATGEALEVGDILNGARITSISARHGVSYENRYDVFVADFEFLDRFVRLSRFQSVPRSFSANSDESD